MLRFEEDALQQNWVARIDQPSTHVCLLGAWRTRYIGTTTRARIQKPGPSDGDFRTAGTDTCYNTQASVPNPVKSGTPSGPMKVMAGSPSKPAEAGFDMIRVPVSTR